MRETEPDFRVAGHCHCCGSRVMRLNGAWLRWFRGRRGLTLREVARRAECSAAFVSDVERNRRAWSDRLAKGYGLSQRTMARVAYLATPTPSEEPTR